jgi:maltose O-acetyltransferase
VPLSVRLRGNVHIDARGEVVFGESITLIGNVVPIEFVSHKGGRIFVGDHTFINYGSSISAHELVSIGRHCLLGHYTFILDNNQHDLGQHLVVPASAPVIIEDNAWIGSRSIILPGVHIGHNAVIGAGSVVTKHVPPWCVAVGNPAQVVRRLDTCPEPKIPSSEAEDQGQHSE